MLRPNSVPEQISGIGVTVLIGFVAILKRVSIVFLLLDKEDSRYRLNYDIFPILISPYICKRTISYFILIIFVDFR